MSEHETANYIKDTFSRKTSWGESRALQGKKLMCRFWEHKPGTIARTTGVDYLAEKKGNFVRVRSEEELVVDSIRKQLKRLDASVRNIRATKISGPEEKPLKFVIEIGRFINLPAGSFFSMLCALPVGCGSKRVLFEAGRNPAKWTLSVVKS